ncbi:hypothetical protein FKW77_009800 [Venturia effusa]|uniref:Zn(2)-C6 fungal-type domain-containing protein n=1 Tax=Venturia effusa TaxID=50376 RepID=A0A517L237_9PEZI|nr:hypothetical protein FKW77_009800 [Venturia effusa]
MADLPQFSTFHISDPSETTTFRGRPSKGCNKCRSRKVKCDEGQPACQRCEKSGIPCVYRDEFDIFLRNQTNKAAEAAQKKWRSRSKKPSAESSTEVSGDHASSSSSGSAREKSLETDLPQLPVTCSLQDVALARFMYDFVIEPTPQNPYSSFFGFVPKIRSTMNKSSPAFAALSAAAFANLAGRCQSAEAKTRSVEEYGRAIQLLKITMNSTDANSCVDLLATSSLLGTYELMTAPHLSRGGSYSAHINGSVAILNQNSSVDQLQLDAGGLFLAIFSQMLIMRMSRGLRPTIPIELCHKFIPNSHMAINMLPGLMYETTNFVAEWNERKRDCDKDALLLFSRGHIKDAQDLDARLVSWMKSRPVAWDVQKLDNCPEVVPHWLEGLYTSKGAPSTIHKYSAFNIAHRWAFWRSTRLTLYGALVDAVVLQTANSRTDEERAENISTQQVLQARMYDLVDDLCQSMFAAFVVQIPGKPQSKSPSVEEVPGVRAYAVMWPLYRAGMTLKRESMRRLDIHHRFEWVRSALQFLNQEMAVAKAKAFLDNLDGLYDESYNWP